MRLHQLIVLCAVALYATSASAALVHRYSFDSDASDSVGGAHGTVVGNTASFAGGQITLDNPDNVSSTAFNPNVAPPATGAYVNFPNHIVSNAAAADQYGAVSFEMWVTMDTNRNWAALFSAGISSQLEDYSAGGNEHFPYLQVVPRSGDGGAGNDFRVISNGVAGPEGIVDAEGDDTDLQSGVQEHIIAVFDQSGGLPGIMTVYRNGAQYGTTVNLPNNLDLAAVATVFPVTGLADVNIWLGRSQWPDPLLDGSVNELRIYSHALTLEYAMTSNTLGPDVVVPEPAGCVLAALVMLGLAANRRI